MPVGGAGMGYNGEHVQGTLSSGWAPEVAEVKKSLS